MDNDMNNNDKPRISDEADAWLRGLQRAGQAEDEGVRQQGMTRVFLHTRSPGKYNWTNEFRDFARVPVFGEYIATSSSSEWYRVQVVVHTPFPCDCDAEVFAVEVPHSEALKVGLADIH